MKGADSTAAITNVTVSAVNSRLRKVALSSTTLYPEARMAFSIFLRSVLAGS